MKLTAQWIVGFVDGEGCFYIRLSKKKDILQEYHVLPEFSVVQHKRDIKLLYALKEFFGCGIIRNTKGKDSNIMMYRVRAQKDLLEKIIPFFQKHELKSVKNINFKKFRKVLLIMEKSEHLTIEGIQKIHEIKNIMNNK
tara:strand:- start:3312 stop:3728 length:417 start_codon:yes stop_codon:yes gene_type:complete